MTPSEVNTHLHGLADSSHGSAAAGTCRPPAAEGWWASGGSSARGRRSKSPGPEASSSDGATWDPRPAAVADGRARPWQRRLGRPPLGLQPLERKQKLWVFLLLRRRSSRIQSFRLNPVSGVFGLLLGFFSADFCKNFLVELVYGQD